MGPVIDVHTHCLTEAWFQLLQRNGAPRYTVEPVRGGLRAIHLDGAPFMQSDNKAPPPVPSANRAKAVRVPIKASAHPNGAYATTLAATSKRV